MKSPNFSQIKQLAHLITENPDIINQSTISEIRDLNTLSAKKDTDPFAELKTALKGFGLDDEKRTPLQRLLNQLDCLCDEVINDPPGCTPAFLDEEKINIENDKVIKAIQASTLQHQSGKTLAKSLTNRQIEANVLRTAVETSGHYVVLTYHSYKRSKERNVYNLKYGQDNRNTEFHRHINNIFKHITNISKGVDKTGLVDDNVKEYNKKYGNDSLWADVKQQWQTEYNKLIIADRATISQTDGLKTRFFVSLVKPQLNNKYKLNVVPRDVGTLAERFVEIATLVCSIEQVQKPFTNRESKLLSFGISPLSQVLIIHTIYPKSHDYSGMPNDKPTNYANEKGGGFIPNLKSPEKPTQNSAQHRLHVMEDNNLVMPGIIVPTV